MNVYVQIFYNPQNPLVFCRLHANEKRVKNSLKPVAESVSISAARCMGSDFQ